MPEEIMLQEAIEAIRQEQHERARDLLTRLLRKDQHNPAYWLWMSAAVETDKERVYCLETVLQLDPHNLAAKQGLELFSDRQPDEALQPLPQLKRKWQVQLPEEPRQKRKIRWNPRLARVIGLLIFASLVLVLMVTGILTPQKKASPVAYRPSKTPGPPPTYTSTPTYIGYVAPAVNTPEPNSEEPLPLLMLLEATYTPTPPYVNTPHPINEAFGAAKLEIANGNVDQALNYLEQAVSLEPAAADILFEIGEIQRLQGNGYAAIQAYGRAISANPFFAPSYLGRARARMTIDPQANTSSDLDKAIQNDPYFGEAYLERAAFRITQDDLVGAEEDLRNAQSLLPYSPLVHFYRGLIALGTGDAEQAFTETNKALDLDQTSLPIYRAYAEAALLSGKINEAIDALKTYLDYEKEDAEAWEMLGKAYAGLGNEQQLYEALVLPSTSKDYQIAEQAMQTAIAQGAYIPEIKLYQGIFYLQAGEGQPAVNELFEVRKQEAVKAASSNSPNSLWFAVNVGFGRALLAAGRYQEAYAQFEYSNTLVKNDEQKALIYFWRGQANEKRGNLLAGLKDWQALIAMPDSLVPQELLQTAEVHAATLSAPTQTRTPTITASLTPTRTPTVTKTPTPSRTPTPSPTLTVTKIPTLTATPTNTPIPTQ